MQYCAIKPTLKMKLLPFNELLSNFSKQFGTIQLNKTRNQPKRDSSTSQCSAVVLVDRIAQGCGRRADGFRDGCTFFFKSHIEIWISFGFFILLTLIVIFPWKQIKVHTHNFFFFKFYRICLLKNSISQ